MGKERTRNPFYGQIIRLVIPVVIQNLLSAAVSSADVVMLNYVSQDAISAVSLASQYANVLFMIYYGLGTGATMLCAQYYGKKDYMAIRAVEGIALRFSLIVSAVFAALALCVPEQMMRLFTNEQRLIELGADYLRYMSVAYLCWSVIEVYLSVLRSMERVTICMVLNMVAFGLNVLLNAVFIFGLFGAPKMGVSGVALATAISRVVELLGCILVSICSKEVKLDLRYLFIRNKPLFGDFVKLSLPALGNEFVTIIKESSIVSVISIADLMFRAKGIIAKTYNSLECLAVVAIIYFILTFLGGRLIALMERRMSYGRKK